MNLSQETCPFHKTSVAYVDRGVVDLGYRDQRDS